MAEPHAGVGVPRRYLLPRGSGPDADPPVFVTCWGENFVVAMCKGQKTGDSFGGGNSGLRWLMFSYILERM